MTIFFVCLLIFYFVTGSHVAQPGLKLSMWSRMGLNPWSPGPTSQVLRLKAFSTTPMCEGVCDAVDGIQGLSCILSAELHSQPIPNTSKL